MANLVPDEVADLPTFTPAGFRDTIPQMSPAPNPPAFFLLVTGSRFFEDEGFFRAKVGHYSPHFSQ